MKYLYYILNKLNLTNNSTRLSFTVSTNSNTKGKVKTEISISSKDIKMRLILYIILAFFLLLIPYIWFSLNLSEFINNVFNFKSKIHDTFITVLIFLIVLIIIIIYIILKRNYIFKTKESKPKNINIYNRELPDILTPAHARLLVTDGKIDTNTLASTILDLIDRKYLKLESNNREKLFTKNILITKTNKSQEKLFSYEKYLINWLFNEEKITSFELHKKLTDESTNPYEHFCILQGLILISFPFDKYYKKTNSKQNFKLNSILFIISLMIYTLNITIGNNVIFILTEMFSLITLSKLMFIMSAYL